jgi:UDP-N-acetyl-2-amino-2-deoxyglucuronate dehydrogenase
MAETVGYGIIGCGVIGPWHGRALTEFVKGARLVAVADEVPEKAKAFAEKFNVPHVHTDYHELLARPDIDAVSICTPSGMHGDMVIAAAQAGKHAMTEKPMDIRLERIDAMVEATRRAGTKLGVIFQRRTFPLWQKVRETVQSGKLGRMVLGDAYLKYFRSQEYYNSGAWRGTWALDGGGALMNQGVHLVDQLQWIMGPVESVYSLAGHLVREIEVEDTTVSALRFRSGAFGVLEGATSVVGLDHRLEFHGDRGSISIYGEKIEKWIVPGEEMPTFAESEGNMAADPTAIGMSGHIIQLQDFVDAIREDRRPMVTGEDGRAAVEIILAVYRSARTGQPVTLPLAEA